MEEYVRIERDGPVATIRLDRPPANAFFRPMSEQLQAAAKELGTDEAVRAYEESVARDPANPELRTSLAVLYKKIGRTDDARKELVEALRAEPRSAAAHFQLGRLHLEAGDRGAALEEYKLLKDIDAKTAEKLFGLVYK